MANITKDEKWLVMEERKSLILEHHMAASRFGFLELFAPLYEVAEFDTSLRDGTLPELSFLANVISPLVKAYQQEKHFVVANIVSILIITYSTYSTQRFFIYYTTVHEFFCF